MVSALFQHITIPKKVSALLQQNGVRLIPTYSNTNESVRLITAENSVRLIPPFVRLIPTDFEIENSVRLNTAVSKKVSALLQQSSKKCLPYYSTQTLRLISVCLSTVPHLYN